MSALAVHVGAGEVLRIARCVGAAADGAFALVVGCARRPAWSVCAGRVARGEVMVRCDAAVAAGADGNWGEAESSVEEESVVGAG